MKSEKTSAFEESLDPEDWESMRKLGHRMVDDIINHMKNIREYPVWQHAPDSVRGNFNQPLPMDPQTPEAIYEEFLEYIMPYPSGNIHPRFWGWVLGTGTVLGSFAELLASSMNVGASGGLSYHSANYVEDQVIEWFKTLFNFPLNASGLLTSGCSAANLIALAVARNTKADYNLRKDGIHKANSRMVLYASSEIHSSIQKAIELLGLGGDSLRKVPTDDLFRIDHTILIDMIAKDRQEGYLPFCVVGAAGTTNTGAVDDLKILSQICTEQDLWFHVDGAFGAWAILAPNAKEKVQGMELADSLAFDLHKWMYMPYEIGCVLIRHEEAHRQTFSLTPAYLTHGEGNEGMTGHDLPWLSDYGFQLSRGFRALKAWMSLKEHGIEKYGRIIQQNIDQAHYLEKLIQNSDELELMAPVTMNVVCFRYIKPDLDETSLNDINKQIVIELQEKGIAVPSITHIQGKDVLHIANTNHRTLREDFDILVNEVIQLGHELVRLKIRKIKYNG